MSPRQKVAEKVRQIPKQAYQDGISTVAAVFIYPDGNSRDGAGKDAKNVRIIHAFQPRFSEDNRSGDRPRGRAASAPLLSAAEERLNIDRSTSRRY